MSAKPFECVLLAAAVRAVVSSVCHCSVIRLENDANVL